MEGAGKAAAPRLLTLLRYCNEHVSQAAFSPDAEPSPPPQLSPATSSPATIHDEDGDHRGRTHVRHPVEETAKPAEDTQLDQIMTLRAKYDSLVAVHDSLLVQLELSNKRCDVLEAQLQAMRRVEKFLRQDDHSETSSLPTRGDSAVPLSENSAAGDKDSTSSDKVDIIAQILTIHDDAIRAIEIEQRDFMSDIKRRYAYTDRIDNAGSQEVLLEYYRELNCGIEGSGDAGMFVGCSEDDMRTFRERVMLRLALFEQLRTAM